MLTWPGTACWRAPAGDPIFVRSMLNPRLETLSDYPFRRLAGLLRPLEPPPGRPPVDLSIGQPMHPLAGAADRDPARPRSSLGALPAGQRHAGVSRRRSAAWLARRYRLPAGAPRPRAPRPAGRRHQGGAVPDRPGGRARAEGRPAAGGADAQSVLQRLSRRRGVRRRRAGAAAGTRPATGYLPALDELEPDAARAHRRVLSLLAGQPAGLAADLGYLQRLVGLARASTTSC